MALNTFPQVCFNEWPLLSAGSQVVLPESALWTNKNTDTESKERFTQGRVVLTHFFPHNHTLRLGTEHFYSEDYYQFHSADTASSAILTDHLTAGFADTDIFHAKSDCPSGAPL